MRVEIVQQEDVDLVEVIKKSTVKDVPHADDVLRVYILNSVEFWVGKIDGEIACVFGLIPPSLLADSAYLWLLTTDTVEANTFLFIRHSQRWIEDNLKRYKRIHGHVLCDNESGKRWLRFLGAKFYEPEGGRQAFEIRNKRWTQ